MNASQTAEQAKNACIVAAYSACVEALMAMGREGANSDLKPPLRKAWEECRAVVTLMETKDPLGVRAKPADNLPDDYEVN